MDRNKLEISGKESSDPPTINATYRPIPDTEYMEEQALTRLNSNAKNHTNSPEADGAHEKMLPGDDTKLPQNSSMGVKIIPSSVTSEKDMDGFALEMKPAVLVGMGKEELMKYANDPFWVRLRWILFVCFWLLWVAMLVGAILIIVAAPKCAPPEPKTWWEEGPLTEVNPLITESELNSLKDDGVKGVIAEWPLDTYESLNESAPFMDFLNKAKTVDINVIVGLEPGTSSLFFNDSEAKDDSYVNYYIWQNNPKGNDTEPPNNWLTPSDTSAWKYSPTRKQFYYAPFGKPWLNFRDPKVQEEFSTVIKHFLDAGARGVRLSKASYLLVDREFGDESVGTAENATLGQYRFYHHHKTEDLLELGPLLKKWKDIVKNKTEDGPFMLVEDRSTLEPYKINGSLVIDLPRHSQVFNQRMVSGIQIKKAVDSAYLLLEKNWAAWESSNTGLDPDVVDIVISLLPGTAIIPSNHTVDKELLTFRTSPSIMYGSFETFAVSNETTFAYIRVTPSNPGYLVALNPTNETVKVDFPKDTNGTVQEEITVQLHSKNYNITNIEVKVKISSREVLIPAKAAIIFTYVPKSK